MTNDPADFLPYGRHAIDEDDINSVVEVLRSNWLTTGPNIRKLEKAFAKKAGSEECVVCANGTAALHLATLALSIGSDESVVVPSITFLATANAVRYCGAEVIFADVDPDSGQMTAQNFRDALTSSSGAHARAVFPVYLGGQCCAPATLKSIANEFGTNVVEDACHALGTTYATSSGTHSVGSCEHADMGVFSLHPVKAITMGEGGVITTNDSKVAANLRKLRNHGIERDPSKWNNLDLAAGSDGGSNPWYYEQTHLGFNYRATDIQCALGLSQLRKLDQFVNTRQLLARRYDKLLGDLSPLVVPAKHQVACNSSWHLYVVLVEFDEIGIDRRGLMLELRKRGIGTQVHYIPVHFQPYYRKRYGNISLPGAERYYRRALSLPIFPAMTESDVDRVVSELAHLVQPATRGRGAVLRKRSAGSMRSNQIV